MKNTSPRLAALVGLVFATTCLTACGNGQPEAKGSSGMFGLFGKKAAQAASSVAAEVGAPLQRQQALPAKMPAPAVSAVAACQQAHIRGNPPKAEWVTEEVPGETRRVFLIPAASNHPPLAVLASADDKKQVQVWELSREQPARFVKQRQVNLDPAQASWTLAYPVALTCLPAGRAAIAVGYHDPRKQEALYVYDAQANQFTRVSLIEPERSMPPPFTSFEVLAASPNATLVLYHTGAIRLGADKFAYQQDHIRLFSPRYPNGLEIATLDVADGNVRAWAMQGSTLWLRTEDKRKQPQNFIWSLDISKVL
jgi:hypothetical protein